MPLYDASKTLHITQLLLFSQSNSASQPPSPKSQERSNKLSINRPVLTLLQPKKIIPHKFQVVSSPKTWVGFYFANYGCFLLIG